MNGTTYVMTQAGAIYNSDLNSITSWNTLGVIQAIAYPDRGVGLCRYKHHIVAFGQDSVEFFNDVGNPPPASPLERTEQAFIKFGCAGQYLFINVDDRLYWVSSGSTTSNALWRLDGYTPVEISKTRTNLNIARNLSETVSRLQFLNISGTKNIILNGINNYVTLINGFTLDVTDPYTATYKGQATNIVYSIDFNTWWSIADDTTHIDTYYLTTNKINSNRQHILKVLNTSAPAGNTYIYYVDQGSTSFSSFQDQLADGTVDATSPVAIQIQVNPIDFGTESRKFFRRLTLICDFIYNDFTDTDDVLMYMRYSRKEFVPSVFLQAGDIITRTCSPSTTNTRYYFNNLGAARKLTYAFYHKSKRPFRAKMVEINVAQGTG
jgi:hypothetical protein